MKKIILITLIIIILFINPIHTNYLEPIGNKQLYLTIPNLINKEPVLQYHNNEYYLNHDINGNTNIVGSTFLDYRNNINDNILLIYSHNSNTIPTVFNKLEKYYNYDYYTKNKYIYLTTNNITKTYYITYVSLINKDYFYTNINPTNKNTYINKLKQYAIHQSDTTINEEDNILILQTCSYKIHKEYLLIIAKECYN